MSKVIVNDDYKSNSNNQAENLIQIDTDDSHHEPIDNNNCNLKSKRNRLFPQLMTTVIVSWLSLIAGYAAAYSSPAEPSIVQDLHLTKEEISWIVSLLPVGALIGALSGGPLIHFIGRRPALIINVFIYMVSWAINLFSSHYWSMYLSRILCGYGVGITSFALPVYLAEIVQHKIRGRLGIFPTAFGNLGILICFSFGNLFQWKGLAGIGVVLVLPLVALIWLIPETPRWYLSRKKPIKARSALQWLRGENHDITKELEELINSGKNRTKTSKARDKLCTKLHIKALAIVLALMFFQQFSGINAIIFYMTEIFQKLGTSVNESLCTTLVGVVNFISTFIAAFLVDKLGRKILMYISCVTLTLTLSALGAYFYLLNVVQLDLNEYEFVPVIFFILYVLGFSFGLGPIPWLMMGELLPATVRGIAAAICTAFNFTCTFIITKSFLTLEDAVGVYAVFWFFAGTMLLTIVFLYVFVPETKKRTLEEIEKMLSSHSKIQLNKK